MIDINFIYSVKYSDGIRKWNEVLISDFKKAKPNEQVLKQTMTTTERDDEYDAWFSGTAVENLFPARVVLVMTVWYIAMKIVGNQPDKAKRAVEWLKRIINVMDPFGVNVDKAEYIKALTQYVIDEYKLIDILEGQE